jgi:hypothetical protein
MVGRVLTPLDLGSGVFLTSAVQLEFILGSSRTAEGKSAWEAKLLSASWILLCLKITRPPFLHARACCTLNLSPQPLQCVGRSGGDCA